MSTNQTVFVGAWTNWSKGPIAGSTLTLSNRNGAILIAILALFVQVVGGQSWSIICFATHQSRTTRRSKDGLYHQQQTILRNSSSDAKTIWDLTKIAWFWRPYTVGSLRKSIGLIVLGAIHLVGFAAAGIFSSRLALPGNEVLLARNPNCGLSQQFPENENPGLVDAVFTQASCDRINNNAIELSKQYVANCLPRSASLEECNSFKTPQLNYTVSYNEPCPFSGNGTCLGPADGALKFDTGLIDSRDDLGINTDDASRVQYRRTSICSPITTEGYVTNGSTSADGFAFNFTAAFYGVNTILPFEPIPNATYVRTHFNSPATQQVGSLPQYTVFSMQGFGDFPELGFNLSNAPLHEDNFVAIVFASYSGDYTGPSNDLWLPATKQLLNSDGSSDAGGISVTFFDPDKDINVLACRESHQFCNPSTNKCTPLLYLQNFDSGSISMQARLEAGEAGGLDTLNFTDLQTTIAQVIYKAAAVSTMNDILHSLESSLLAEDLCADLLSTPLADNQWVSEMQNLFSTAMASIQRSVVNSASAPGLTSSCSNFNFGTTGNNVSSAVFCENQIIQDGNFTSFTVLGIGLVFGIGGLVICISVFLEHLVGWMQTRFEKGVFRQRIWQFDYLLQMQRMVFEEMGRGNWRDGRGDVPVTEQGEEFGMSMKWLQRVPTDGK